MVANFNLNCAPLTAHARQRASGVACLLSHPQVYTVDDDGGGPHLMPTQPHMQAPTFMQTQDLFGDAPEPPPRSRPRRSAQSQPAPRHSWFLALRPAEADAQRIDAFADMLMAAQGVSGNRVGPDRLHITLDAIGHDVDEPVVAAACRAADAVRTPAFDVRFDAAMSFAGPSGPFVLLDGERPAASNGLHAVRALRLTLGCALADQGFVPPRAYEPHMTLCYDPHHRVARAAIEPVGFRATEFVLIRSHVGLSRHEVLRSWPLTG